MVASLAKNSRDIGLQNRGLKGHHINYTAVLDFLKNQQVLVSCNKIIGTCFYNQVKKIIISLIPAKLNMLLWFKSFSYDKQKILLSRLTRRESLLPIRKLIQQFVSTMTRSLDPLGITLSPYRLYFSHYILF